MVIFIDANIFCAIINENDVHHKKAKEIIEKYTKEKQHFITTDYIFDEAVSVTQRKLGKQAAILLGRHILHGEVYFIQIDKKKCNKAWKIFQEENNFSFTDCTNIACMQELNIKQIATFDKEFKKEKGIEVIDN
ncbi:MAG: PIN domain-containing protein [bacterium]|nr:PIN domain-containing protein [bacterium]